MAKVKFLQDFRGRETREVFYVKDQIVEIDDDTAQVLIADGRAKAVLSIIPESKPADKTTVTKRSGRK